MRLIDADALLEKCNKDQTSLKFAVLNLILHCAPTIDAVEAVRCKDCEYLERNYCDEYGDLEPLFCKNWVAGVDEDGYCYEAERREP